MVVVVLLAEDVGREEGKTPAGDATEPEKMKSSIFITSELGEAEASTDSRSFAIPEGALLVCLFNLMRSVNYYNFAV